MMPWSTVFARVTSRLSLRGLLVTAILLALLPVLLASGALVALHRANEASAMETNALRLATIIGAAEAEVQQGAEQMLCALAHSSSQSAAPSPADQPLLQDLLTDLAAYSNLAVVSADGALLCSAVPYQDDERPDGAAANVVPTSYFRRAQSTGRFTVGYGSREGQPHAEALYYAYPLMDAGGRLVRLYVAERNVERLDALTRQLSQELPAGFRLTLVNTQGTQIGHAALAGSSLAEDLDADLVAEALRRGQGVVSTRRPGHPEERLIMAVAPARGAIYGQSASVIVSAPARIAYGQANRTLAVVGASLVGSACVALLLGSGLTRRWVVRKVQHLVAGADRLARGDLTARLDDRGGPAELGRIAAALNEMAVALENRERERAWAHLALKEHADQLALFPQRLMEAQEQERRRIARELHDDLGQQLTVLGIWLKGLRANAQDVAQQAPLQNSVQLVNELIERVRRLALDLRPSLLDDLGLGPALRYYVSQFAERTDLLVDLHMTTDAQSLDPQAQTAAFRLTQEALTNALKHAQATRIDVALRERRNVLELVIRDNGVGFDVAEAERQARAGKSLGLLNMVERAALAGGKVTIDSSSGGGTEIVAQFPLHALPVEHAEVSA